MVCFCTITVSSMPWIRIRICIPPYGSIRKRLLLHKSGSTNPDPHHWVLVPVLCFFRHIKKDFILKWWAFGPWGGTTTPPPPPPLPTGTGLGISVVEPIQSNPRDPGSKERHWRLACQCTVCAHQRVGGWDKVTGAAGTIFLLLFYYEIPIGWKTKGQKLYLDTYKMNTEQKHSYSMFD